MMSPPKDNLDIPADLRRGPDNKGKVTKMGEGKKPKPVVTHPPEGDKGPLVIIAQHPRVADEEPPKPTSKPAKAPAGMDEFGIRLGTKKSKAAAMYAAGSGATLNEVKMALGQIHYNVLSQLEAKGFKVDRVMEGDKKRITRYRLYPK
jgi:hypothetical protein